MEREVVNNQKESRFEWHENGQTAVLEYEFEDGVLALVHTGVPKDLEGQGIAARLARFAMEYAKDHEYLIIPYCPYIQAYLKKHPEYNVLVKKRS